MAEKKEKQYVSDNAQLMKEWNWEKNNKQGINPAELACGSNKKVWWQCRKGHEWQATIANRNNGNGCPICINKRILPGYNDLKTINPSLAAEWNYDKNDSTKPEEFAANSGKRAWWKCGEGHEWQAVIASRNTGVGCPICARNRRKTESGK